MLRATGPKTINLGRYKILFQSTGNKKRAHSNIQMWKTFHKTHLAFNKRLQRQIISTKIGHQPKTPWCNFTLPALTSSNTSTQAVHAQLHVSATTDFPKKKRYITADDMLYRLRLRCRTADLSLLWGRERNYCNYFYNYSHYFQFLFKWPSILELL